MAPIKQEMKARLNDMSEALDSAGESLANVREKLLELKSEIGDAEFMRQKDLKDPSPEFLKYVSVEVWANTFEGLIQQFGGHEQKMRNDIRTQSVEYLQSTKNTFCDILDGLTSLVLEYAQRLLAMVMKSARALMSAASEMWQIVKNNPGKLAAFLFGATVGGAAAAHAGLSVGLGFGIATGGVAIVAGLLAVGVFYACSCAYQYACGKIQEYKELTAEVERLKKSVDSILICDDLSAGIKQTKEDMFHQMDVYESKFLQCDDAP